MASPVFWLCASTLCHDATKIVIMNSKSYYFAVSMETLEKQKCFVCTVTDNAW